MAGKLVLMCSVTRVPALDTGAGATMMLGFALNLSVGWSDGIPPAADMDRLFVPWLWPKIVEVKFYWDKGGSTTTPAKQALITQPDVPAPPDPLKTELKNKFDDAKRNVNNLVLNLTGSDALQYKLDQVRELKPWHALLNHVSTYPFPLPQSCNIAHLFRVSAESGALNLIAAPVLVATGDGTFPQAAAEPTGLAAAASNGSVSWSYTSTTSVEIEARLQPAPVTIGKSDLFNLEKLWVEMPGGTQQNQFTFDWQASLELRLADAFQLSQFLLEFLREQAQLCHPPDGTPPCLLERAQHLEKCVDMVLASLRDVVGLGASKSPDGVRFAQRLFELFPGVNVALLDAITDAQWQQLDLANFQQLSKWREFLRGNLVGADAMSILLEPQQSASVAQTISELEWLQGTVLDVRAQEAAQPVERQASLWDIFATQWNNALDVVPLDPSLTTQLRHVLTEIRKPTTDLARDLRRQIDLRQQLALSNLGRFWADFIRSNKATGTEDPNGHHLLDECFPAFLRFYAGLRLGLTFPAPAPACTLPTNTPQFAPSVPAGSMPDAELDTAIKAKFETWIRTFSGIKPTAPPVPTATPHAITVQVARAQVDPEHADATRPPGQGFDPLEQISGVGVLMREVGTSQWLPLNLASPRVDDARLTELLPGRSVLVPSRLYYRGELRQTTVSYNNHPLAAESPLSNELMTSAELKKDVGEPSPTALLRYMFAPGAVMPGLKFGANYEFAVYAIHNSGVVPREIATSPDSPCVLRNPITTVPPNTVISPVPYPRLVPIGALRTFNCNLQQLGVDRYICNESEQSIQRYKPLELAPLPATVAPRARDISILNPADAPAEQKPPLVLLTPVNWPVPGTASPNLFAFKVRLPATSWECWDRWVAKTTTVTKAERVAVLAGVARRTAGNKEIGAGKEADVQLDDPSVERQLYFILMKEVAGQLNLVNPTPGLVSSTPVPVSNTVRAGDLQKFQGLAIPIICRHTDTEEGLALLPAPAPDESQQLSVKVKKGEVYRLTVCALVTPTNLGKFGAQVVTPFPTPAGVSTGGLQLVSPAHFVIEAATEAMPADTDVYDATQSKFFADGGAWKLRVEVAGTDGSDFRHAYRAEIDRQVWRWLGRATAPHPDLIADRSRTGKPFADYQKELLNWEAIEFGERPNSDHIIHDMQAQKSGATGLRTFSFEELLGRMDNPGEKSLDLRGLHFRYATRLYSRYEGILPPGVQVSSESAQILNRDPLVKNRWRSQFVPCRQKPNVEPPKIRFILPLTQSFGDASSGGAGVLVVLDERWHEAGGLGEFLEAEVMTVADPNAPPNTVRRFFQLGPDPIITRRGLLGSINPAVPSELDRVSFHELIGPVGHFYDRSSDNALFVNSSFLLPAPSVNFPMPPGSKLNTSWYFARVRFRRIIKTRLPVDSSAAHTGYFPDAAWKLATLASNFTEPMWIQFLPEFSIYDGFDQSVDSLHLAVTLPTIQLLNEQNNAAILSPFFSDNNIFSLYVVLTARVFDVTGRTDQETFVGLFKQGAGGTWVAEGPGNISAWSGSTESQTEFIARVIEVQAPRSGSTDAVCQPDPSATLWDRLFGKRDNSQQNCDAAARIVRISRPIESKSPSGICPDR